MIGRKIAWGKLRSISTAALIIGASVFLSAHAEPQSQQLPKRFYQNDYAAVPGQSSTQTSQKRPKATRTESVRDSALQGGSPTVGESAELRGQEHKKLSVEQQQRGYKSRVFVFVNSLDRAHFAAVIEELQRLGKTRNGLIATIYHIGDYRAVTPEIRSKFALLGISILQRDEVPLQLSARVSPTWWIVTAQGAHLVEGVMQIESLVDEWGEYDPKRTAEAMAGGKMEGF